MAKKEEEDEKKEEMSELDISFSPSHFPSTKQTPDELINGWIAFQTECREELLKEFKCESNCVYGASASSRFDVWRPKELAADRHVHIFLHGGYWQESSKEGYCSLVRGLLDAGILVVMLEYEYASRVPLDAVVEQVKAGVEHVKKCFSTSTFSLGGHSAGVQLVAKVLEDRDLSADLTAAVLICGVFDLKPLVQTYIGRAIHLTPEMAARNSVQIEKTAAFEGRLLVISAHFDAPALIEQGREFVEEMQKKREIEQANYKEDHFSIISALYDPKAPITKRFVSFLQSS